MFMFEYQLLKHDDDKMHDLYFTILMALFLYWWYLVKLVLISVSQILDRALQVERKM